MAAQDQEITVRSLSHGGQLFIHAIRRWALAMAEQRCFGCDMQAEYEAMDMLDALPIINEMMCFMSRAASFNYAICHPDRPKLDSDEAAILAMMRAVQRSDKDVAVELATHFFPGPFAMTFLRIARAYTAVLDENRISLEGTRRLFVVPTPVAATH